MGEPILPLSALRKLGHLAARWMLVSNVGIRGSLIRMPTRVTGNTRLSDLEQRAADPIKIAYVHRVISNPSTVKFSPNCPKSVC